MAVIVIIVLVVIGIRIVIKNYKQEAEEERIKQIKAQREEEETLFEKKQKELANQYLNSGLMEEITNFLCNQDGMRRLPLSILVTEHGVSVRKKDFYFREHRIADLPYISCVSNLSETGAPAWALATAINTALGGVYREKRGFDSELGDDYNTAWLELPPSRSF